MTRSLGRRRERSDKRYASEADRQRAFRERMSRQRQELRELDELCVERAFLLRRLGLRRPSRFGWAISMTVAQILRRENESLKLELMAMESKEGSKQTAATG